MNNYADDSLDIVFASQSGETSVSVNQPFHKYAVAPAELEGSEQADSTNEFEHLDDSGYHKNNMVLVCNIFTYTNTCIRFILTLVSDLY